MRLHLIDGTYELFRAHFSKRPSHTTPDGLEAKATVGVVSSLLALLEDDKEAVTHVAVAFDNPIRSFRNELFAGYKTEDGVPPELLGQFDLVEDGARAMGLVVWSMKDFEADDALATGAARFRDHVQQVRIMSPDKDLGQCLRGNRVVQVDRLREKELDEAGLLALRGVKPQSVPDLLALTGDAADGVPGLAGWGEKGASAVLGRYGHLEAIPSLASEWAVRPRGAERLAATLNAERDTALLYRRLTTLVEDVPLKESWEDLRWRGVPRRGFEAFCQRIGSQSLVGRPTRWNEAA
jgi:5'-3' exonuclease